MSALSKAFSDAERSYGHAKASVGAKGVAEVLARGPSGMTQRSSLSSSTEQLRHFTGWVYSSIRPIAQRIAGQPIRVAKTMPGRTKSIADLKPLDEHPLLNLLADPNEMMVAWSLIFSTVASMELTGRSLWWLPEKKQILPIPTSWIVETEGVTSFTSFKIRPPENAEPYDLPADECCLFCYPNPADPRGAISPLQAIASAVDADESISSSQAAIFRNGIHPTHVVKVGKNAHPDGPYRPRLSANQRRQIIDAIKNRYSGTMKHGEPLILDGLIEEVSRLSNTPEEMDFLNSAKQTKERITQGFGVNPIILGEVDGANRASATVADRHFCDFTVNPKIELISQCLTAWLSPMFGGGLRIWIEPCVPNDSELKMKWAEVLTRNGAITLHELRRLAPLDLSEDRAFDGQLVGGRNMSTTNAIEAGIREMIGSAMADQAAESLMQRVARKN